jgi:hypothetical protein
MREQDMVDQRRTDSRMNNGDSQTMAFVMGVSGHRCRGLSGSYGRLLND